MQENEMKQIMWHISFVQGSHISKMTLIWTPFARDKQPCSALFHGHWNYDSIRFRSWCRARSRSMKISEFTETRIALTSFVFLCLVFLMLSRLFIAALWSPAGKGLIGDWSWNNFYGHSPPFHWIIQEGLLSVTSESMCTKYWLTACSSLPRKKCG